MAKNPGVRRLAAAAAAQGGAKVKDFDLERQADLAA
jgi:hypothetical protein